MKSSREQFEEWIANTTSSDLHRSIMLDKSENGSYRHIATNNKWDSWQASRAEIEIELPRTQYYGDHWSGDWALDPELVVDSLNEAGVKVKS